jgi:LDH2 family malate/lactate/ureidoglycolate dehydrogenase
MTTTPPAPGYNEVVMPGALGFRTREQRLAGGIPVAEETWQQIVAVAGRLGIDAVIGRVDGDRETS